VFYCTFVFLYNIVSGQLALLLLINNNDDDDVDDDAETHGIVIMDELISTTRKIELRCVTLRTMLRRDYGLACFGCG